MTWSSRDKLNSIHLGGAICVAAIIGGAAGSWLLFLLVAGALIGAGIITGDLRPRIGTPKNQPGENNSRRFRR